MSYQSRSGTYPILVSIPHNGADIPPGIVAKMTDVGRSSRDTDWYLDRLYQVSELNDASWIVAETSRYVIDLNRPHNGETLYPGQATTGLVPTISFDASALYLGEEPDAAEIQRHVKEVWQPYHCQLQLEIDRLISLHHRLVLLEAHSIASVVPRLFDGVLPDFNIGTNRGKSCDAELENSILEALTKQNDYSHVANGRFIGGYITRHYGNPSKDIHAVQIELSQSTYLDEASLAWNSMKADRVQKVLRETIRTIRNWLDKP